ncbi:MAG: lactate/malate family dehydrogenase [Thermodesulfobacteriota bacterium]
MSAACKKKYGNRETRLENELILLTRKDVVQRLIALEQKKNLRKNLRASRTDCIQSSLQRLKGGHSGPVPGHLPQDDPEPGLSHSLQSLCHSLGRRGSLCLGVLLSPAMGAVLMSLSTVIVAINAKFLKKVAIVGTGNVGATFAYALMMSGLADDIPVIGRTPEKVKAHVMDLNHGMMFVPPTRIYEGNYSDCRDADLVVVTAGKPQEPGETRQDLADKNTEVFRQIIPQIARYNPGNLLIVTNPVDILQNSARRYQG